MKTDTGTDAAMAALNAPAAVSNAKIAADRRKANRFFDSGYVVDADADPDAAVLLPAGRQVSVVSPHSPLPRQMAGRFREFDPCIPSQRVSPGRKCGWHPR